MVAPTSGGYGDGVRSGPCSLLGIESGPDFTPLPVSMTLIVRNAALQRDAAPHVRVISVLFKAGE